MTTYDRKPFVATFFCLASAAACILTGAAHGFEPSQIRIVDRENGWPVPLVELKTTHEVRFVSDNAGLIAFDLPELMNQETWFHIEGHGYGVEPDRFGNAGVRLTPQPGRTLTVKVERRLPGKRLGRITGGGIFGESQQLGLHTDWKEQGILGCDSVQNAVHNGRLFWSWGDTTLAGYPLGLFHMIGATTDQRPLESLQPPVRLRYDYVTDEDGDPREIAKMPGQGPTWLSGFASLPDAAGQNHLVATYAKIKPPLEAYCFGLCVWDEETQNFQNLRVVWQKSESSPNPPTLPLGHSVHWTDDAGTEWILFGDPFPALRCHATFEAWTDPDAWKPLTPQATVPTRSGDAEIKPHRGAIAWSDYRDRWITVFTQEGGEPSYLGEIFYAEADSPTGPWQEAIKVVTHSGYTFYNPQLHVGFTAPESPVVLFEATYTKTFSGADVATPRHNYNQILYRLDLDELQSPQH